MNAPANITALDKVRALYRGLSEADQLAIMCDLIQSHDGLTRSDAFIDELIPLDKAFGGVYEHLDAVADAEPDMSDDDAFWRESVYAERAGLAV